MNAGILEAPVKDDMPWGGDDGRPIEAGRCRTTRWSVVFAAATDGESARKALGQLYRVYWSPVHAFIARSWGREAATELSQEFFMRRLVDAGDLRRVQRRPGQRFRGWLFTALRHFLSNHRRFQHRACRDARKTTELPSDADDACPRAPTRALAAGASDPERQLQRARVLALLADVLARLRREYCENAASAGVDGARRFEALKVFLPRREAETAEYAACAAELGMTTAAVKQTVHRLRQRLASLLERVIRDSVQSDADVQDAKRALCAALEIPDEPA